jgi:SAM-dependent methyltransferase
VTHSKSFDRIADSYDETRGGDVRGRWIAGDLNPLLGDAHVVLEIGIGTATIAAALAQLGRVVVGIDIGYEMLTRAHGRIGSRLAQGDATSLPVRSKSLPAAFSVWLLHLVDVRATLAEAARVLQPAGRYVVSQGQSRHGTDVEEIEQRLFRALEADDSRGEVEPLVEIAQEVGFRPVSDHLGSPQRYGVTPAKAAVRIEQRTRSVLWDVDDVTWHRLVEPATAEIRALPSPDERRMSETRASFLVLER